MLSYMLNETYSAELIRRAIDNYLTMRKKELK
jgi:hypothetical protein